MSSSGVDIQKAKRTWNKVNEVLENLGTARSGHIKMLGNSIERLNKEYWYGGAKANKWYDDAKLVHSRLQQVASDIRNYQEELNRYFEKSKTQAQIGVDIVK